MFRDEHSNGKVDIVADKKTSKSSTAPYSKDDLNDLLDILKEVEALVKGSSSSRVPKSGSSLIVFVKRIRKHSRQV